MLAKVAASRIDFKEWLRRLNRQKRLIALSLATGESTRAAAKKLRLTADRISQIRRESAREWKGFHGEPDESV